MGQERSFGAWLKEQRIARHLTQEELAERVACSTALIRKIEAGLRTPSRQTAELIAAWLQVPEAKRDDFLDFARGDMIAREPATVFPGASAARSSPVPGNIPAPLTPLIGRSHEIESLLDLLVRADHRLLTLVGPPGIGKTRLALQAALDLREHISFTHGVFFVTLAPVSDPDLVVPTIAQTLGVQEARGETVLALLKHWLKDKKVLLVLDNFEQVLDASPVVLELLGACVNLKVLVTSREALHVHGEQQFQVRPLEAPDPAKLPSIETMENIIQSGGYPAVTLFLERAREVKPDFELTGKNARAVAAICARLQGLPLAIELAAARVNLLSTQEIQTRLDNSLPLLESAARHLPPKQRTLRGAIDWSYRLLGEEEKALFARLGVFVGGCTLEAAQEVCNPEGESVIDILGGLASLVDKNLLQRGENTEGESRFATLELIRQYAVERLAEGGEAEIVRRAHAEHFMAFVEAAEPELFGPNQRAWFDRLERDHDNVRAALRWALNRGELEIAARLSSSIVSFWTVRGYITEGSRWLEQVIAESERIDLAPPIMGKTLNAIGNMVANRGDHRQAIEYFERAVTLWRQLGAEGELSAPLMNLGSLLIEQGDYARVEVLLNEAITLQRRLGNTRHLALSLYNLGLLADDQGDCAKARRLCEESLLLLRKIGDTSHEAHVLISLGDVERKEGHYHQAEDRYREALMVYEELNSDLGISYPLAKLAITSVLEGEFTSAAELYARALPMLQELGDKDFICFALIGVSLIEVNRRRFERTATLLAVTEATRQSISVVFRPAQQQLYDKAMIAAKLALGEQAFAQAWEEGRAMSIERAIEYALE